MCLRKNLNNVSRKVAVIFFRGTPLFCPLCGGALILREESYTCGGNLPRVTGVCVQCETVIDISGVHYPDIQLRIERRQMTREQAVLWCRERGSCFVEVDGDEVVYTYKGDLRRGRIDHC